MISMKTTTKVRFISLSLCEGGMEIIRGWGQFQFIFFPLIFWWGGIFLLIKLIFLYDSLVFFVKLMNE